jgi:hypothetical protein
VHFGVYARAENSFGLRIVDLLQQQCDSGAERRTAVTDERSV